MSGPVHPTHAQAGVLLLGALALWWAIWLVAPWVVGAGPLGDGVLGLALATPALALVAFGLWRVVLRPGVDWSSEGVHVTYGSVNRETVPWTQVADVAVGGDQVVRLRLVAGGDGRDRLVPCPLSIGRGVLADDRLADVADALRAHLEPRPPSGSGT